jgi:hypothetical protein
LQTRREDRPLANQIAIVGNRMSAIQTLWRYILVRKVAGAKS